MTVVETPAAPPATDVEIFERAADIIEEWGWCQFSWFRSKYGVYDEVWSVDDNRISQYCMVGALWRAAYERGLAPGSWGQLVDESPADEDPFNPLYKAAGLNDLQIQQLVSWNDDESTTSELAVGVLRGLAISKKTHEQ